MLGKANPLSKYQIREQSPTSAALLLGNRYAIEMTSRSKLKNTTPARRTSRNAFKYWSDVARRTYSAYARSTFHLEETMHF